MAQKDVSKPEMHDKATMTRKKCKPKYLQPGHDDTINYAVKQIPKDKQHQNLLSYQNTDQFETEEADKTWPDADDGLISTGDGFEQNDIRSKVSNSSPPSSYEFDGQQVFKGSSRSNQSYGSGSDTNPPSPYNHELNRSYVSPTSIKCRKGKETPSPSLNKVNESQATVSLKSNQESAVDNFVHKIGEGFQIALKHSIRQYITDNFREINHSTAVDITKNEENLRQDGNCTDGEVRSTQSYTTDHSSSDTLKSFHEESFTDYYSTSSPPSPSGSNDVAIQTDVRNSTKKDIPNSSHNHIQGNNSKKIENLFISNIQNSVFNNSITDSDSKVDSDNKTINHDKCRSNDGSNVMLSSPWGEPHRSVILPSGFFNRNRESSNQKRNQQVFLCEPFDDKPKTFDNQEECLYQNMRAEPTNCPCACTCSCFHHLSSTPILPNCPESHPPCTCQCSNPTSSTFVCPQFVRQQVHSVYPVCPVFNSNIVESGLSRLPYDINIVSFPPVDFGNMPQQNRDRVSTTSADGRNERGSRPREDADDANANKPIGRRPPTIICYICGKEYGTASIGIHEKQCLERWRKDNSQLPKQNQRPEPVKPEVFYNNGSSSGIATSESMDSRIPGSGKGTYDLDIINAAAFESAQGQLSKCDKCGRTFLPDRLKIHSKSCRGFNKIN